MSSPPAGRCTPWRWWTWRRHSPASRARAPARAAPPQPAPPPQCGLGPVTRSTAPVNMCEPAQVSRMCWSSSCGRRDTCFKIFALAEGSLAPLSIGTATGCTAAEGASKKKMPAGAHLRQLPGLHDAHVGVPLLQAQRAGRPLQDVHVVDVAIPHLLDLPSSALWPSGGCVHPTRKEVHRVKDVTCFSVICKHVQ